MRISDAFHEYVTVRSQEGYSQYTLNGYTFIMDKLIKSIGDKDLNDCTLSDLRNYIDTFSHLKKSSQATKIRAIRSIFGWFYEEELIDKNIIRKLKEPKLPRRVPKALSQHDLEMLREACRTIRERAMLEFFYATGCRVGEVFRLDRDAIDMHTKSCIVLGKADKEREVYFGEKSYIWIERYLNQRSDDNPALFVTVYKHKRLAIHEIQRIFNELAIRSGINKKVTPHTMRHTLATSMLNNGSPLVAVQSLLGHEKPETTQIYAQLSGEARKQNYKKYFVQ